MIYGDALSLQRKRRQTIDLLLLGFATACALTFFGWALTSADISQAAMLVVALLVLPLGAVLIWRSPIVALYGSFICAVMVESNRLGAGLSLTDRIPAFVDIQSFLPLRGVILTPIECLAFGCIVILLLKKRLTLRGGPLIAPFGVLLAVLVLGVFRGHEAGGDLKIALWGVRSLFLMFAVYLLTVNLIKTPAQARLLLGMFLVGAAAKGAIGLWRYVVDFHGQVQTSDTGVAGNALMEHEESFFFLIVLLFVVVAFAFGLSKRDKRLALISSAFVLIPFLANQRRVAIAALILCIVTLAIVIYVFESSRRRGLVKLVSFAAVVLCLYGAWGWSSTSLVATPVQAVKSTFEPNQRDASSNDYRKIEDADLRATAKTDPLLGVGFGLKIQQAQPLPDISDTYTWYLYLPHNGYLWLGMTTGLLGLVAFEYVMGSAVLKSVAAIAATAEQREMRALYVLSLLSIVAFSVFVLLDQGILSDRLAIFVGAQMGLLALAPAFMAETHSTPGMAHASETAKQKGIASAAY
ncbi:MAG TPA: O-antigen ligase family protein [Dehalococcoidia bacterium]|nr:O-antigen ligase family protein [Dehalococcoidia bacterium]